MSKFTVEKEGDPEIDQKVHKLRTKVETEELIRKEIEDRRR